MSVSVLELEHILEEKSQSVQPSFIKLGYRPELDGFRGISIILVFIHHIHHSILPGGFLGVDMFFVLSGFLITSLLLEEWNQNKTISLKNFYIRRIFRLMPAVFFLVLVLFAYAILFLNGENFRSTFQGIWLTLSYTSNWFYAFDIASADNPLGVTWSLAIEEQFYLIFPILLYFALRYKFGTRQIVPTLIFFVILIAIHRKILADGGSPIHRLYYASDTRADALLIGCLTAFLFSWNLLPFQKIEKHFKMLFFLPFAFLLFMTATANASDALLYSLGGYSLIAISVAALLLLLLAYQPKAAVMVLSFAPLVWIGRVSYGLYLWHWTARYFIYGKQIVPESYIQLVSVIIISFIFTVISYYCIEKPFLRMKERFSRTNIPVSA